MSADGRPLASLIALSKDGEWGKSEPFDDSVLMRIIRGTDFDAVREGDWSNVPARYVARKPAELKGLLDNDILIETAGGSRDRPTGRTLFIKPGTIASQGQPVTCASFARFIRLDQGAVDPSFVYWWLQDLYETGRLLAFNTQHTGVARFQWTTCSRSIRVPDVSRSIQRKIAAVLSAYDDLIENCRRRITLLEGIAHQIYREWFVDFRYPGHEHVPLVDSESGPIPDGWAVAHLGDAIEFVYGKALTADTRREGSVTVFGSGGVIGLHDHALAEGPGIIVGRKGNVGSVYWSDGAFFAIDTTYWVRSRLPLTYCYYALREMDFLDSHAAVPGLSREQAYSLPLLVPDLSIAAKFDARVLELFALRHWLVERIANLRATRDLLLRRLMSGELDAADLDIDLSSGAA
jgi:type I restriction enzyme S subunit